MLDDRTPILIGGGQVTQRDGDPAAALEPARLMERAARLAAADAHGGAQLLAAVDSVQVVNMIAFPYGNAPRALADLVGAHPTEEIYSTLGGNTPQWLVSETAERIAAGAVGVALLAGAECLRALVRAQRAGVRLDWRGGGDGKPNLVGDRRDGTNDAETRHGLTLPVHIYPLFENAIRAARRESIAEHRTRLGRLCASLSAVAAEHPQAWFRTPRTPEEITTPSAENRMIAFPYPKRMNAIIDVDQAAAILMTSVGRARALGIPEDRWVYLWGSSEAHDHWFVSERVGYASSPAIRAAGRQALATAGLTIADIEHVDLYSCFPSAVQLGREALGIPEDDPRPLTVTGGLAYFGGPGNNYVTHSIATMLDRVRARPGTKGLVTALGWYATKHAIGIYAAEPRPFRRADPAEAQGEVDRMPPPAFVEEPDGAATIETYTVLYGRGGEPERGLVIGRQADGRRFLANTPSDREVLERLTTTEGVGLAGVATRDGNLNRFDPG